MRRSSDFGAVVRRGRHAGSGTVVVHVLPGLPGRDSSLGSVVVGFIASKAVGGAVVRNRTKRRLRAVVRPLLPRLAPGTRVVVRAQPTAALAPTSALGADLTRALQRAGALLSTGRP
jgi:ribonuclease P protein component